MMFSNIGGKIKKLAKAVCWIGIIFSCIAGIGVSVGLGSNALVGALVGLLVAIIGSLLSWIGSFFMYGFGELVENSKIMAETLKLSDSGKADEKTA